MLRGRILLSLCRILRQVGGLVLFLGCLLRKSARVQRLQRALGPRLGVSSPAWSTSVSCLLRSGLMVSNKGRVAIVAECTHKHLWSIRKHSVLS